MTEQFLGIIRTILAFVGGIVVTKGYVSAETWTLIAGGVLTIVPAIWSVVSKRPAAIAAQAQAIPGVNVQVSSAAGPAVAEAVAKAKEN